MSAPSESAESQAPCACTNISLMQLFHELKQKFPGVPDHVVSSTIELYCHDKQACETHLHSEVKASLTHAYHASSSAAARQLNRLRINLPGKCRNQPIVKHEAHHSTAIQSITCKGPQTAILSAIDSVDKEEYEPNIDANQNIVEAKNNEIFKHCTSPVTIINIDNCYAKYSIESPSDLELTNDNVNEDNISTSPEKVSTLPEKVSTSDGIPDTPQVKHQSREHTSQGAVDAEPKDIEEQPESTNYRILKSNKVKCNLNEKLERVKDKKTIKKEEVTLHEVKKEEVPPEKPKRPNTLDFIKPNPPDIAFKPTLKEPEETCRTVSPAQNSLKNESQPTKESKTGTPYRSERGYPLNVSVNVNCHMDLSHSFDPWLDFDSPRAITSVNLTVCTPTSNMASPVRDEEGFEGHVTVTVSPSSGRAPRRRAPPPPSRIDSPRPTRVAPEPPVSMLDRSLIDRQKERLGRLASALAQEKGRLEQLNTETNILAGPPPTPVVTQRLRDYVEYLRDKCGALAKRLEMHGNEPVDADNFYSNIYTGQRPPASWQCHMCTFRNHPLLDKCEECDMPRIVVGTSPPRTHDSGFGSFRDRNRRPESTSSASPVPTLVSHRRADWQSSR